MSLLILILEIIFFLSLYGVLHTYLFYPLFMLLADYLFTRQVPGQPEPAEYPRVDVIFAAYNEEAVILEKLESIFNTSYPREKLGVRVGSDASTDRTDAIIREFQRKEDRLIFRRFEKRTGKAQILNELVAKSQADYLLFTDANIIFQPNTVNQLLRAFADPKTGIAGGTLVYTGSNSRGISN
jgi:cellulose synthase/poly-beta-1,6-N-acetylglucosamine synthase-like glycosyltransferase